MITSVRMQKKENPDGIFDTNIFGKTIRQLVDEGIHSKVNRLTEESQVKLQDTIQKSGKRFKRRISLHYHMIN